MRSAAVLVLLAIGGCAASAPAPVVYGRTAPPAAEAPPSRARAAPIDIVRNRPPPPTAASRAAPPPPPPPPDWAAGPGTPLSVWALQPEEAAPFDPRTRPRRHVVAAGETLYALSVRYQIPLRPLIEVNRLDAPFTIAVGQVLQLPPPRTHRVRAGETLVAIARRYNVEARSLALLNRLPKPYAVAAGDVLALPPLARGEAAPAETAPPPAVAPSPSSGPTRFAWPLRGTVLTRFGPQDGGRRSDGVDIAAAEGADVEAAADGVVVYAGDDLEGYGNLMLVQHDGGWITAYAHCSGFAVKEGDRVRRGQKIGAVGKTGGVSKLHFQVRRGSTPTDPLTALPPV